MRMKQDAIIYYAAQPILNLTCLWQGGTQREYVV